MHLKQQHLCIICWVVAPEMDTCISMNSGFELAQAHCNRGALTADRCYTILSLACAWYDMKVHDDFEQQQVWDCLRKLPAREAD